MKKKRLVVYITYFVAYMFYIILIFMQKKSLLDWEKVVEEEGTAYHSFKNSSSLRIFDLLYEILKLLNRSHGDQKSGKANQWRACLKTTTKFRKLYCFLLTSQIYFILDGRYPYTYVTVA